MDDKAVEDALNDVKLTGAKKLAAERRSQLHRKQIKPFYPRHWGELPETGGMKNAEKILGLSPAAAESLIYAYVKGMLPVAVSKQLAGLLPRLNATADG